MLSRCSAFDFSPNSTDQTARCLDRQSAKQQLIPDFVLTGLILQRISMEDPIQITMANSISIGARMGSTIHVVMLQGQCLLTPILTLTLIKPSHRLAQSPAPAYGDQPATSICEASILQAILTNESLAKMINIGTRQAAAWSTPDKSQLIKRTQRRHSGRTDRIEISSH